MQTISDIAIPLIPFEITNRISSNGINTPIVILTKEGKKKYFEIDELTNAVLSQLDENKSFRDVFTRVKVDFQLHENEYNLFHEFSKTQLYRYLFDSSSQFDTLSANRYVFLKISILSQTNLLRISKGLTFLFKRRVFVLLSLIMAFFLIGCFFCFSIDVQALYKYLNAKNSVVFSLGYLSCVFFHELGHAAAALHFKAKPNHIGFGFYLFTPIMYCDVSDIWILDYKKRITVDLAGIYFQWILSTIFVLFFMISGSYFWIFFSFFNFLSSLLNLNPLLRFDGYWALSDLLQTPNLRRKSFTEVKHIVKEMISLNVKPRVLKQYFILIYGFLSFAMIGIFLYFMIFRNTDSLIYYFRNIADLLLSFFNNSNFLSFDFIKAELLSLIAPTIFYVLVVKFVISKFKTRYGN